MSRDTGSGELQTDNCRCLLCGQLYIMDIDDIKEWEATQWDQKMMMNEYELSLIEKPEYLELSKDNENAESQWSRFNDWQPSGVGYLANKIHKKTRDPKEYKSELMDLFWGLIG